MSQNVWLQMKYKKPANQVLIGFRREIEKEDELQHPARPNGDAVVWSRGVLRPRRISGDSRHEPDRRLETPGAAAAGAFDRRNKRLVLCRYFWMGSNPSQPHGVRNDFAWRRRTSRLLLAHP